MRVALLALVLVIGAAIVLFFANTLNTWVLGGLLGGLAALLISIPISLALFTLLARRHEARQSMQRYLPLEEEPAFAEESYEDEVVVYESESALPVEYEEPPTRYIQGSRHQPVSGYLRLPPPDPGRYPYEEEEERITRREPRNYPRQPRTPTRNLTRDGETRSMPNPEQGDARRRNPSTRSLAQHQSDALRIARREAQQDGLAERSGSRSLSRRPRQTDRSEYSLRPRQTQRPRPPETGSRRPLDERDTGRFASRARERLERDEDTFTDELRERYPRSSYPRNPRSGRSIDPWTEPMDQHREQEERQFERRPRRTPDRESGNLRNPLVRRAPYLYDDDPLREEFAQQLDNERPINHRSSRYRDEEEY